MLENSQWGNKKVNIFEEASRDIDGEEIDQAVNELTNNGENPGALFPERYSAKASVAIGVEVVAEKKGDPVDAIKNLFGVASVSVGEDKLTYEEYKQNRSVKTGLELLLDDEKAPNPPEEENNPILAEALTLIKARRSVIPVGKDKRPLINWKEYHTRIATESEVREWFTKWPEAQLGLVTGKISRLAVVDVEKEFGDYTKLGLPKTKVSRTGSGGYHLFYTYVEGVRNKARINNQEIDIRGEGGYVIVPPSFNQNGQYEWIEDVKHLPEFPVSIFPPEIPVKNGEYQSTIDYNVNDYPGFGQGQRNNEMAKYAGALLSRLHPDFWDNIGWPMYEAANEKNDPPLPHNELERTWGSICQAEETQSLERWQERNRKAESDERLKMLDDIKDDDVVSLGEAADRIRSMNPQTYATGFATFDNAMRGGFKEGDLVIVTGMSGHGKTTLGQTFTYHMIQKDLPVLWFSYEVSADILDDKFKAMKVPSQYKVYVPKITATGDMIWVENKIKEAIDKFGVKCIFVDLIDFLSPKDQKRTDSETLSLKRTTTELKNIAREQRVVMFVMAHVRKQKDTGKAIELQDVAHSSGIYQLSDYVFCVERVPLKVKKEEEKSYDGNTGQELKARKQVVYSTTSEIRILKNRYTGMLAGEKCELLNDERFHTVAPSVPREMPKNMGWIHK